MSRTSDEGFSAAAFEALISSASVRFVGEPAAPAAAAPRDEASLDSSIAARSAVWLARRDERVESTRRALEAARREEENESSFRPRINAVRALVGVRFSPQKHDWNLTRARPALFSHPEQDKVPAHIVDTNVIDRQETWTRARNERLQSLARAVSDAEQSECTFAPNISAASRLSDRTFLSDDVRFARAAAGGSMRSRAGASAPLRRNADIDAFAGRLALARQRAAEDAAYAEAVYSPRRHGVSRTVRRKDADAVAVVVASQSPSNSLAPPQVVEDGSALFDGTAQPRFSSSSLYAAAESPNLGAAQPRALGSSAGSIAASLYATAAMVSAAPALQQPAPSSSGVARVLLSPQTGQVTWRTTLQK